LLLAGRDVDNFFTELLVVFGGWITAMMLGETKTDGSEIRDGARNGTGGRMRGWTATGRRRWRGTARRNRRGTTGRRGRRIATIERELVRGMAGTEGAKARREVFVGSVRGTVGRTEGITAGGGMVIGRRR
jgi:hypothetical protein